MKTHRLILIALAAVCGVVCVIEMTYCQRNNAQKITPSEVVPMKGFVRSFDESRHESMPKYRKNVSQSSRGRHGLGVSQNTLVSEHQTFGESKGCLPGGDEPRKHGRTRHASQAWARECVFQTICQTQVMCETSQPGGVSV